MQPQAPAANEEGERTFHAPQVTGFHLNNRLPWVPLLRYHRLATTAPATTASLSLHWLPRLLPHRGYSRPNYECINGGYGGDLSGSFATNWWLRAHRTWVAPMAHKPMHDGIGYGFEGVLVLFMAIVDVGLVGIVKFYTSWITWLFMMAITKCLAYLSCLMWKSDDFGWLLFFVMAYAKV